MGMRLSQAENKGRQDLNPASKQALTTDSKDDIFPDRHRRDREVDRKEKKKMKPEGRIARERNRRVCVRGAIKSILCCG